MTPLQRAYLMGFRRAKAQAKGERDELADRFEDTVDQIRAEMRGVRNEMGRLRMIDNSPSVTLSVIG